MSKHTKKGLLAIAGALAITMGTAVGPGLQAAGATDPLTLVRATVGTGAAIGAIGEGTQSELTVEDRSVHRVIDFHLTGVFSVRSSATAEVQMECVSWGDGTENVAVGGGTANLICEGANSGLYVSMGDGDYVRVGTTVAYTANGLWYVGTESRRVTVDLVYEMVPTSPPSTTTFALVGNVTMHVAAID